MVRPSGWVARLDRVSGRIVRWLNSCGLSLLGSRELVVSGRRSGQPRSVVVNLLTIGDQRYLVAPRGHTEWVRNLRAAGHGQLKLGRRAETIDATEVADADKPAVLREYLRRWAFEVGVFFDGLSATSSEEDLLAVAPGFPVFRVRSATRPPEWVSATAA